MARPAQCLFCDGERVWFNGWRRVLVMFGELDIEALPRGERTARLAELAARTYQTPGGRERRFSVRTL